METIIAIILTLSIAVDIVAIHRNGKNKKEITEEIKRTKEPYRYMISLIKYEEGKEPITTEYESTDREEATELLEYWVEFTSKNKDYGIDIISTDRIFEQYAWDYVDRMIFLGVEDEY